jgi:DNA-binding beta-propeller fold protein YncE
MFYRQQLKRLENCAYRVECRLTMKSILVSIVAGFLCALVGSGCMTVDYTGGWRALEVSSETGFATPECVVADSAGNVFVANILPNEGVYWDDDGMGFVSRVSVEGRMEEAIWLGSRANSSIHSPKGMCILDGWLYINDSTRVKRCKLDDPNATLESVLEGGERFNDAATDGRYVWVSDIKAGQVIRIDPQTKETLKIPAPAGVNGVTVWKERLFSVSWTEHDVYELDPAGEQEPRAFGLADHFTNLDGIEVLDDGSFIVSDFKGNKVSLISSDEKTVYPFIEILSPADIGIDRGRGLLYVPQFTEDKIVVFRLKKRS